MAGLQVRAYEMARALGRKGHEVSIAALPPVPPREMDSGVRYIPVDDIASASRFDVWIATPLVAKHYYERLAGVPFVMDGYEAPFGSFLAHGAALLPALGGRVMHDYRNTVLEFMRSLEHADLILCATGNQRICYLSLLCLLGRINPKYPAQDMVAIVQSGAPPELPKYDAGIGKAGPVVLWAGGAYSWFDPGAFVSAMPRIIAAVPEVRFVFAGLGGRDQIQDDPLEYPSARRILEIIRDSKELSARSRFVAWQPYADRGVLYSGADVGVCTYRAQIETVFSMRTRVIDMVWGGLPVILTEGDPLGASLEAHGAGATVAAESPDALAETVAALLKDPERCARMADAARKLASSEWSWDAQINPLHHFCLAPRFEPGRGDALVRRTTRDMIRLGDNFEWRVRDLGWRVWWRLARFFSSRRSSGGQSAHVEKSDRRP